MKNSAVLLAILFVIILAVPIIGMERDGSGAGEGPEPVSENSDGSDGQAVFKVMLTETGEVVEVPEEEYICGVVAAEMGAGFHEEALKAQTVASYTYACMVRDRQRERPDKSLNGADLCDSSSVHQAYLTDEKLREKWGENYEKNMEKIKKAVDAVAGQRLVYDGEPVLAVFHAMSSGRTESSEVIWDQELPYLNSVTSSGDALSPGFVHLYEFTYSEFAEILENDGAKVNMEDAANWIGKIEKSDAGTVTSAEICGKKYTGQELRNLLGLSSAVFDVTNENDKIVFRTYGMGHGVGMSQYGAEYMAEQGASYEDILKHYYTGVEIVAGAS